jgi:poly-beta-1,6-N-acetyl-D-glucosamine N-deacetylase
MVRTLLLLLLASLIGQSAHAAETPGTRFVSVAFHDVVDDVAQLDGDAITTDQLIAFFEWMRADGWAAISLDDVVAAQAGNRPLPAKAMLITFDDGYASLYTRVFPLARAYRLPIVAALVGSWQDVAPGGLVAYGDQQLPRERFISWPQAREMQASGWIEFASHSHDLHRGVVGNPQGNLMPAAVTAKYDAGRYETVAETFERVRADLQRSRDQLARELGRAPRAIVWPFGRYSQAAQQAAAELGYRFALTLDPEPASALKPMALARFLPTDNPRFNELAVALRYIDPLPAAQRLVCIDPGALWSPDPAEADRKLGEAIERVRSLGSTAVVIDALQRRADGSLAAWFPTERLPLAGDVLSRVAWQMQTRAGVLSVLRLPQVDGLAALAEDLARLVPVAALWIDAPTLAALPAEPGRGAWWAVRERRQALALRKLPPAAQATLQAVDAIERQRPGLRMAVRQSDAIEWAANPIADLTLRSAPPAGQGALPGSTPRRVGLWLDSSAPPEPAPLAQTLRDFQQRGGTIFGWCPDDTLGGRPPAAAVAPDASASTFPVKF